MGRTGTALDRERHGREFHRHLEDQARASTAFPDREVARSANFFEYLEGFYNRSRRLHSALSYRSPMSYDEATIKGIAVA